MSNGGERRAAGRGDDRDRRVGERLGQQVRRVGGQPAEASSAVRSVPSTAGQRHAGARRPRSRASRAAPGTTCRRSRSACRPRAVRPASTAKPHTMRIVDRPPTPAGNVRPASVERRAFDATPSTVSASVGSSAVAGGRRARRRSPSSETSPSPSVSKSRRAWKVGISAWSMTTSRRIRSGSTRMPGVVVDREVAERMRGRQRRDEEHAEDPEQDRQRPATRVARTAYERGHCGSTVRGRDRSVIVRASQVMRHIFGHAPRIHRRWPDRARRMGYAARGVAG